LSRENGNRQVLFRTEYPFINKTAKYPVGRPTYYDKNFPPLEDIFGVVKCRMLPPKKLLHPVLPYRFTKLTFPLCRKCVEKKIRTCTHSDDERALTATWCTPELHEAIRQGYRVLDVYSAWHYDKSEVGLFRDYIDRFYKTKTESSDYPKDCVTEEQKEQYIRTFFEREGILLDRSKIARNEGLRSLAKYMLNSFCECLDYLCVSYS